MKRVLFVCSQNRLRSPTAEQVFSGRPGMECASAGTNNDADNPLTSELVEWADVIFVMEKAHRNKLTAKFKRHLHNKRVICLDIPDEYEYMDPMLVQLLKVKVLRFFPHVPPGTGEA
ncbi:low molecular weight protein tyrosine phosphatase family protein [Aquabacterium humicola]|uniref:low molecular weight protein tyrosine phosphatase family protein n=1 Tax=Aquabacterium humicola TaxID=3237377 RepID=UPI002543A465|nr:low molecular weight protein tyrosine phosphatase family protein [Rubrivivax pictus]